MGAWDRLMGDFKDSKTALVADVDCTAEGKALCDSNGVQGFPTIKWGSYGSLEDYQGSRSYDDLKKFADEDIDKKVEEGEKKIQDAEENFEAEVKKLQEK